MVDVKLSNTMFIGYDVCHDTVDKRYCIFVFLALLFTSCLFNHLIVSILFQANPSVPWLPPWI